MGKGLSESDVFKAIHQLEKRGIKPTAKAVREIIGSGSMTTITKHLKNWPRLRLSFIDSEVSNLDLKQMLSGVDDRILSEFLLNELPQITALILSHLSPGRAASILNLLPSPMKNSIIKKIEGMAPVRTEIVELLAFSLKSEIQSLIVIKDQTLGGKVFANSIKKQMAS